MDVCTGGGEVRAGKKRGRKEGWNKEGKGRMKGVREKAVLGASVRLVKRKGACIAIYGNPSHNYGMSLAVWDHTVLPATRHKRTHPAFTPARQAGTRCTGHLRMEG